MINPSGGLSPISCHPGSYSNLNYNWGFMSGCSCTYRQLLTRMSSTYVALEPRPTFRVNPGVLEKVSHAVVGKKRNETQHTTNRRGSPYSVVKSTVPDSHLGILIEAITRPAQAWRSSGGNRGGLLEGDRLCLECALAACPCVSGLSAVRPGCISAALAWNRHPNVDGVGYPAGLSIVKRLARKWNAALENQRPGPIRGGPLRPRLSLVLHLISP